jgi:translation elongation factor P/translation initiation factor 5A
VIATTTKVRGEDIRAGQYIVLDNKAFRILQNDRARHGGDGALKLKCNWSNPWRGYECRDTFQVVTRLVKK